MVVTVLLTVPGSRVSAEPPANVPDVFDTPRDLLTLSVRDGMLHAGTDLPLAPRGQIMKLRSLPANAEYRLQADVDVFPDALPGQNLRFTTPPDSATNAFAKTTLSAVFNTLDLSQDMFLGNGKRTVQYIQRVPLPGVAATLIDPPVKLYVLTSDPITGRDLLTLAIPALSFDDLRRRHPAVFAAFVLPTLWVLDQEGAVCAPNPVTAAQVLLKADPLADNRQRELDSWIRDVGSRDRAVADKAISRLEKLGPELAAHVSRMDRGTLSAEQNSRLDELLARLQLLTSSQEMAMDEDPIFLIGCLYIDDAGIQSAAKERIEDILGRPIAFTVGSPREKRLNEARQVWADVFPFDPRDYAEP